MSKVKKMKSQVEDAVKVITKEELENVKHLNGELQKHCNTIGAMEVQKALKDINVIMNMSESALQNFGGALFDVARDTASSFDDISAAATEFARQGLSADETLQRIADAMTLTRLSGMDSVEAVNALTAAINGFGKL